LARAANDGLEWNPDDEATMSVATTAVRWSRDIDQALTDAKAQGTPILLDFSAAPA